MKTRLFTVSTFLVIIVLLVPLTPSGASSAVQSRLAASDHTYDTAVLQGALNPPSTGAYDSGVYRNLFKEWDNKSDKDIQAKLEDAWNQFFVDGDDDERLYYEVDGDMGYILTLSRIEQTSEYTREVRTEGMSYGMMIAVQMPDQYKPQKIFDRLWKFANKKMQYTEGPRKGYFAWLLRATEGCVKDETFNLKDQYFIDQCVKGQNPASDGEEWFAMALFFAAGRWGNDGKYDYQKEANEILNVMLHKEDPGQYPENNGLMTNMFRCGKQVVFTPIGNAATFTDPSYHLPAFYELWARWADEDNQFWYAAAAASRRFFKNAAHPQTGLTPDYAQFNGTPGTTTIQQVGLLQTGENFGYDAWRVAMNIAVDYAWFANDPWQITQSDRLLNFFHPKSNYGDRYTLDGNTQLSNDHSIGLVAMNAVAGLASTTSNSSAFIEELWEIGGFWPWNPSIPEGNDRYYNGMLYMLALLHVSGNFQIYEPPGVTITPPSTPSSTAIDAALIIDSSGSMESNDPQDLRKEAAKVFINAMENGDQIAIIDFDHKTDVLWPLKTVGSDRSGPNAAVDTIDSSGGTNIGAGLQAGFNQFASSTFDNPKAAVLLTDGVGDYNDEANLYANEKWGAYTIGLGNATDENLLRQIAGKTCGQYYALSNPDQLVNVYFDILGLMTGASTIFNQTTHLQPGETRTLETSLTLRSTSLIASINWPGSTVDTVLIDPNGRTITPETAKQDPNIDHSKGTTFEQYRVTLPELGNWKIQIFGANLPSGGENVTIKILARGKTKMLHFPLILKNSDGSSPPPPPNNPPNSPSSPSPSDGATGQSVNVNLSWTGGDPDPGDTVTYDVYFEVDDSIPDVLICNDVTSVSCDPGTLSNETHYYWQVIARDSHDATATGSVWGFTTNVSLPGTWSSQTSPSGNNLKGIICPTPSTCFVVGDNGTILTTNDGGSIWSSQTSGMTRSLRGIDCPTTTTCFIVGDNGTILTTNDGGSTWSSQTSGMTHSLRGIDCPTTTTCFIVGDNGTILTTNDGGNTWSSRNPGMSHNLRGIDCPTTTTCFIVGDNGTILTTNDGGNTWSSQNSDTMMTLTSVSCSNATTGYTVGNGGMILARK